MQLQGTNSFKKVGIVFAALIVASAISLTGASAAGNIVPVMTSNTSPAGTASASSEWAFHEAYKAFDHDTSTYYSTSSGSTGYLQYRFGTSKRVTSYRLTTSSQPLANVPKTWTLQGSSNGGSWVVLSSQSNTYSPSSSYYFTLSSTGDYDSYRLVITANNGAYSTSVAELELYE
ncbi:discoidin domain-containing protein [Paenibacillus donghaensis]|uniref:F5/8 type C domain-containing protein n=1 Tax=Paenibacillus donghaensis TaxID=414771 RepID=A0A2Z2KGK4_9BACL|nr:discoidin domain-containing protein [Paenibacillus donghaensis]ASA25886.1 hypothetical protein B9T62_37345 [Paenibacillus donghaensis]